MASIHRAPALTDDDRDHIRALREQGVAVKYIAIRTGRSAASIRTVLKGVEAPEPRATLSAVGGHHRRRGHRGRVFA